MKIIHHFYVFTFLLLAPIFSLLSGGTSGELLDSTSTPLSQIISDADKKELHRGHKQTDIVIDALQQTIGRVTDKDQRFMLGGDLGGQEGLNKEELIKRLIEMQEHRMQYDEEWLWKHSRWRKKERDKTTIKSSVETVIGVVKNAELFTPDLSPIDPLFVENERFSTIEYLPKKAKEIDPIIAITALQAAFSNIKNTENMTFLGEKVSDIQTHLTTMYNFFDKRANSWCCCSSPCEWRFCYASSQVFQYKKYLRTRLIPYLCFAQLQQYRQAPPPAYEETKHQALVPKDDDNDSLASAASAVLGSAAAALLKSAVTGK